MELSELMDKVDLVSSQYAEEYGFDRTPDWCLFKIQEELGELTQIYLMMTQRGRAKGFSDEEMRKKFEMEMADVLCTVLLLAKKYDIDLMVPIKDKWLKRLDSKQA